jgi:ribosomal protein S18 acetylase RimI-like enzyme
VEPAAVLAAFDTQVRHRPEDTDPEPQVAYAISSGDGWAGVTWSALDEGTADAVIATLIQRLAPLAQPWEWKHYSYDRPADLPARLLRAGFEAGPSETLMVAETAQLELTSAPPSGVTLLEVSDQRCVDSLVALHDQVFGGDHSALGRELLAGVRGVPPTAAGVIAVAGETAVAAGRLELSPGTDFASLWGGGTLPGWRRRGIFRSLVAHRAAIASARGYRYLYVDASADSAPILRRLGFAELATTTPYTYPGQQ